MSDVNGFVESDRITPRRFPTSPIGTVVATKNGMLMVEWDDGTESCVGPQYVRLVDERSRD